MEKDELLTKLTELGYETVMDKTVPCIVVDEMPSEAQKKRYIKMMDSLGYNSTWGIIKRQGGDNDTDRS